MDNYIIFTEKSETHYIVYNEDAKVEYKFSKKTNKLENLIANFNPKEVRKV